MRLKKLRFNNLGAVFGLLFVLLMFASCSVLNKVVQTPQIKPPESFEAKAGIEYDGLSCVADITKTPEAFVISYTGPPSIEGLKIEYQYDGVKKSFKGLEYSQPVDENHSAAYIINKVLASVDSGGAIYTQESGALVASGRISEGDYALGLDAEDGKILYINFPGLALSIEFENFTILG